MKASILLQREIRADRASRETMAVDYRRKGKMGFFRILIVCGAASFYLFILPRICEALSYSEGPQPWIVAIDPGHGGMDHGAIGRGGTREKDIALRLAMDLQRELEREGKIKGVLIRSRDKGLENTERCKIAKKASANCLVSIHVNGYFSSRAKGSMIYYLPFQREEGMGHGKDRAFNKLGKKESQKIKDEEVVDFILKDMRRTQWTNESGRLARLIQKEMEGIPDGGPSRLHQVFMPLLLCLEMPGCLVEVGYITNPEEERRLRDPRYTGWIVRAIKKGLVHFMSTYGQGD